MMMSVFPKQLPFEEKDSEDLLALDFLGDEYEKSLQPSLANKLQVGFRTSDQFIQTEITEVLDVKQMSFTVDSLVLDIATLKRNFEFAKQVLKASFEKKLEDKTCELYGKLNERLQELQSIHEERVLIVRRSFKQQLHDVLIQMASHYKKYYEDKLAGKFSSSLKVKHKQKIENLEMQLRTSQTLVQALQKQINELKLELNKQSVKIIPDTKELDAAFEQNKNLEMEILGLSDKNDELNEKLRLQNEKIATLEEDLRGFKTELDQEKNAKKLLSSQVENAKKKIDVERMEAIKQLDQQKLAMERDMAAQLAKNKERAADSVRESQRLLADMESTLEERMADERKKYEQKISQLVAEDQRKSRLMEKTTAMEKLIEQQKHEIVVLRQRLSKVQKQWEKKFAILKASMHALKDEAYIRMQLQKQTASLKYASISYGPENSASTKRQQFFPQHPSDQIEVSETEPFISSAKPLPSIGKGGRVLTGKQTVSIPSGIGTEPFDNEDKNEDEEEPEPEDEFVPLPQRNLNVGDYMPVAI